MKYHLPPKYVLDEIEWYEIQAILKYQFYKNQEDWEQTRFLAYLQVQANSKKKWKLEDIIHFKWDDLNYEQDNENQKITKEDMIRIKEQAEKYLNQNKKKKL